jgi:formylglycine-generating enzyme required for sulfatase activity
MDWVTVGDPGNACDVQSEGCFGAVASAYRISKFETTNAQYAEFLNTVAAADPNGLYNTRMGSDETFGGITRSGSSGSHSDSVKSGFADKPVTFISFYTSLRFVNWLHNGQGSGDTETGAYTITAGGITANTIIRNAGATIFLPSENESYKAAYYDAVSTSYFDYPAGSDTQTTCTMPGAAANTANCFLAVFDLTDVGSYTGSASPNGTFDQGGNVWEYTDTIVSAGGRAMRGGSWFNAAIDTGASAQGQGSPLADDNNNIGFRVAMIPEPSTALLLASGLAALAVGRRRRI